jgi:hypothetical protein
MSHDKNTENTGESQDALRHQQDAMHHKVHKRPLPGQKEAIENEANQQPEIPKVGSRDAPGG